MSRPFQKLRLLMYEYDVSQEALARKLRVSVHTVSSRLNGHSEWTLAEMYSILTLFGWPESEMHVLFPYRGGNEEENQCKNKRKRG